MGSRLFRHARVDGRVREAVAIPELFAVVLGVVGGVALPEAERQSWWDVAWQLSVYGAASIGCAADGDLDCKQAIDRGWKVYSVERFYDAPLVYNATFVRFPGKSGGLLSFFAHSAFKRGYKTHGRWALNGPLGAAHGTFKFEAHWRAFHVVANLTNHTRLAKGTAPLVLTVTDEYHQSATVDVP